LDALSAVPDDPDVADIRHSAVGALIEAGERAERTGAPALAASSYATAAELSPTSGVTAEETPDALPSASVLWERAAKTASTNADWAAAVGHADRARDLYQQGGDSRAAARAQANAGRALEYWGRHTDAREQLTAAVEVLRADPDADTVLALGYLAELEAMACSPAADRLTTEALSLGQALDAGTTGQLSDLFISRGIYMASTGRRPEAAAYYRQAVWLAEQNGDNRPLGRALLNLSDTLTATDPRAGAEAARAAAEHLRRVGERNTLAFAVVTLVHALLMLGDWDTAQEELIQAADTDGLTDIEYLACLRGWLAGLRGHAANAETILARLPNLRASEDPQDKAWVSVVEAFTAAARHQPRNALRCARQTLAYAEAFEISHDCPRWAWPLAARSAHDLGDRATTSELLAMLDSYQSGHLAPMLRAERNLGRARLAASDGDPATATSFADAISGLRELSTPYHLAHGLLDHAQYLTQLGDTEAVEAAIAEAHDIAVRLRCQPLLDRAAGLTPARPPVQA
jgi:tetratricopeptide (TPR) repeat protein